MVERSQRRGGTGASMGIATIAAAGALRAGRSWRGFRVTGLGLVATVIAAVIAGVAPCPAAADSVPGRWLYSQERGWVFEPAETMDNAVSGLGGRVYSPYRGFEWRGDPTGPGQLLERYGATPPKAPGIVITPPPAVPPPPQIR